MNMNIRNLNVFFVCLFLKENSGERSMRMGCDAFSVRLVSSHPPYNIMKSKSEDADTTECQRP